MPLKEIPIKEFPGKTQLKKDYVLSKLKLIKSLFKSSESIKLRELANDLIQVAVIRNDSVIGRLALISYSLHKLLTKIHFIKGKNWKKNKTIIISALNISVNCIKTHDIKYFSENLDKFAEKFEKMDSKVNAFFQSLYSKAQLKYAADAFYLGMSLSKAANLTGANIQELQKYVSLTKQFERFPSELGINERLNRMEKVMK